MQSHANGVSVPEQSCIEPHGSNKPGASVLPSWYSLYSSDVSHMTFWQLTQGCLHMLIKGLTDLELVGEG